MATATAGNSSKRQHSDEEDSDGDNESQHYSDEEGGVRIDDIYIPPAPKPVCSNADDGPRIIITKIVNDWFKSYASSQDVGPFHKRFNAIIGPNGSGKSNVIDSMLFVFGYRANRIRCKKVSTLIHNSSKYRNVQSCKVSVHFVKITDMEGDNYNVIPNSEFVISRIANRDNSSYYELNGQRVQFKEIAALLRQHGIDLDHNRFLILQGEVEQIAMMKSKGATEHETGMLEYLEDIIGTSRYKEPLMKLMDRVEVLNEQRSDKLNRLKLIETDMNQLREPMEQAVSFLKLENNMMLTRNIIYQKEIHALEDEKHEKDQEKESVNIEMKEFTDKLISITEDKSKKEAAYNAALKGHECLQKRRDLLKGAFENANTKDYQLQTTMQQTNVSRKKYKQQLATENKKLIDLENLPEKSAKEIKELHTKEEQLVSEKQELGENKDKLLATLNEDTKALRERREELEPKLADLKATAQEARSAFTLAESKLNLYVRSQEEEQKKLEDITESLNTVKERLKTHTVTKGSLEKKIPLTKKSLEEAIRDYDRVKSQLQQLHKSKTEKWSNLESCKTSMQASRSKSRILDSLMQQKLDGNCPGYFGRLGDLGAIDKKYDVAISTACGALDNIVVDTVDTAQWCIEFLKRNNIGRATFIALDKQERFRDAANSRIRTPENAHRLYDLVQVNDDRVRTAFYYALRDTLVANELEQATRIAYGAERFRVVSLQGAMIEISGVMSGGGKTVSRGRMGQSVAVTDVQPDDIKNMESELEDLEQRIRDSNTKYGSLERQINALRPELETMKLELRKFTSELESLKQQEPRLQQELKEQTNKVRTTKANPVEVKKLQEIVTAKKATYESASKEAVTFQKEVDVIIDEINEKMTGRVKAIDKRINETNKALSKVKAEITRLNVLIKTTDRNLMKCKEKITSLEEDIVSAEENLRNMQSEKERIENDAKELLKCMEEVAALLSDKEEEVSGQKQEIADLIKIEKKVKSSKIDVDQKLEILNKTINQLNAEMLKIRQRRTALKLHKIPDQTETEELKNFTPEELRERDMTLLKNELHSDEQIHKKSNPNLKVIEDFQVKQNVYLDRFSQLEEVTNKRNSMRDIYESLRVRRQKEFLEGYDIIRKQLKEMYQMITLGGDANFELVDNFDPFTEGVQFNVRPPKKSWKNIRNLSGGEKTLSSLALVFALHYYKPSPLYVMDEIDAALDFKNVSIVGHYIKERTKNAQFIIISLRPNMFELSHYLVGIYKVHDCTQSLTIDPRKFEGEEQNTENGNNANANGNNGNANGKNIDIAEEDSDHEQHSDNDSDITERPENVSVDQVIDDSFHEMDTSE